MLSAVQRDVIASYFKKFFFNEVTQGLHLVELKVRPYFDVKNRL